MTSRRRRIPAMISKEKRMNGGDDLQGEEENVAYDACRRCDGESQSMVVWVVLIRGGGYGNSQRLKEVRIIRHGSFHAQAAQLIDLR
ncbi:hypothetical protein PIB30_061075 [Stylosanthes scabra]|uniref:Uncharacterized protein n=1 Tax=Stylosanthes scabra TaxID=79078 RepID=A0ABU6ZJE3_9FABA|nr:hypothetical protein [Stylosanthes scabra]